MVCSLPLGPCRVVCRSPRTRYKLSLNPAIAGRSSRTLLDPTRLLSGLVRFLSSHPKHIYIPSKTNLRLDRSVSFNKNIYHHAQPLLQRIYKYLAILPRASTSDTFVLRLFITSTFISHQHVYSISPSPSFPSRLPRRTVQS